MSPSDNYFKVLMFTCTSSKVCDQPGSSKQGGKTTTFLLPLLLLTWSGAPSRKAREDRIESKELHY